MSSQVSLRGGHEFPGVSNTFKLWDTYYISVSDIQVFEGSIRHSWSRLGSRTVRLPEILLYSSVLHEDSALPTFCSYVLTPKRLN